MKNTYTGKDLDILYYFGNSNQPGFKINGLFINRAYLFNVYNFYVNNQGNLRLDSPYEEVVEQTRINNDGVLLMNNQYEGLTSVNEDGDLLIDYEQAAHYVPTPSLDQRYYPIGAGQSLELLTILERGLEPQEFQGFTYPDCIEGFSLIFRNRVSKVSARFTVVTNTFGTYTMDRCWTNTKTIGFLLEEMADGLSQIDKSDILSMTIQILELPEGSADVVSVYAGLVLDFNIYRNLNYVEAHNDMPESDGVLKGGLCLSAGSLKINDPDKYLYNLLVKYEFRGIFGILGRHFNNFFENERGELIFEDGYWYNDDEANPYFSMDEQGNLILENSLLSPYLQVEDGDLLALFDLPKTNLITNKQQIVEIYLDGNNLIHKMQVSNFKYDDANFIANITLEDILNRLNEIIIDDMHADTSNGYMYWKEWVYNSLIPLLNTNGFHLSIHIPDQASFDLDINHLFRRYPADNPPLVNGVSVLSFLQDILAQFGQIGYLKTIDSTKSLKFDNTEDFDSGLILRPAINNAGQIKELTAFNNSKQAYLFTVSNDSPYTLDSGLLLGAVSRSVIKPNHITKVIGTYNGLNEDTGSFDGSVICSYSIGEGNLSYTNDCSTYLTWAEVSQEQYGDLWGEENNPTPFYQYFAEIMQRKYLFGLDELNFDALLSKSFGNSNYASCVCFSLGETFKIDFSNTILPTNYAYQIISSTLKYDGELSWQITGLQI